MKTNRNTRLIRVSNESLDTLKDLAQRSHSEVKQIVDEWCLALGKKLETINAPRISIYSGISKGRDSKLYTVTYVAPLLFGTFEVEGEDRDKVIIVKVKRNE